MREQQVNSEELMAELSPARRTRIKARASKLIAQERSLRDLRQARQLTQQRMAKRLGVKQHNISRLEQRSDMLLSTLRDYVGRMGGELELTARFPDREPVKIQAFADFSSTGKNRSTTQSSRTVTHARVKEPASGRKAKSQHKRVSMAS